MSKIFRTVCVLSALPTRMPFEPWRIDIESFLSEMGFSIFTAYDAHETCVSSYNDEGYRAIKRSDAEKYGAMVRPVVDFEIHTVGELSCLVCYWTEFAIKDLSVVGKMTIAHTYNIPVYMILGITADMIDGWALSCATKVFKTFKSFKTFMRNQCCRIKQDDIA